MTRVGSQGHINKYIYIYIYTECQEMYTLLKKGKNCISVYIFWHPLCVYVYIYIYIYIYIYDCVEAVYELPLLTNTTVVKHSYTNQSREKC